MIGTDDRSFIVIAGDMRPEHSPEGVFEPQMGSKTRKIVEDGKGGVETLEVAAGDSNRFCLTDEQAIRLATVGTKVSSCLVEVKSEKHGLNLRSVWTCLDSPGSTIESIGFSIHGQPS